MRTENIGPTGEKVSTLEISGPPEDRFCDLVMKGGITSGVVYPRAISLLSCHYRFRGIGGTSAGAIAAAITAAAEYQRREKDSNEGFALLNDLPNQLGTEVKNGKRKLLSLFQPQPSTRRLFTVLVRTLNKGSTKSRWFGAFKGLLRAYWPATVVSIAIALVVAQNGAWFAGLLLLVIALLISIGFWVYLDITRGVVANGFGLCSGLTEEKDIEALTPWLYDRIQSAAGLDDDDEPLTFGHLWEAKNKKFPPAWLSIPEGATKRSIDLQMFSTNLTHGRPYVFPLAEPEAGKSRFRKHEQLYFTAAEMRLYFPPKVVKWMIDYSPTEIERKGKGKGKEKSPLAEDGTDMLELPEPKNFPVLLATRMSLAFPFLISAVPLYAIDTDSRVGERKFRRCWFADGGISSNFPIHLFDGLVPIWPTFGIHLEPEIEGQAECYLPPTYEEGYEESWTPFAEKPEPVSKLGGFIGALINVMQNWNDNTVRLMPGFRDRVVRIRLKDGEGGMNLNMEPPVIEVLAKRGEAAAEKLIQRFAITPTGEGEALGWDEHRFVRFNNLLKMLKARTPGLVEALSDDCKYATKMGVLLEKFSSLTDESGNPAHPTGYEERMTVEERNAYNRLLKALNTLGEEMVSKNNNIPFKPIPKPGPELRVRPPL